MPTIEGELRIRRPPEDVFDFVADERNEPKYNPRMVRAEQSSDGPIGVGTTFRVAVRSFGRTSEMDVEFTEYDRPSRLASVTRSSWADFHGALTFEPVAQGTRMSWTWVVEPRGLAGLLMRALVGLVGRRQERAIWGNLKQLLERA